MYEVSTPARLVKWARSCRSIYRGGTHPGMAGRRRGNLDHVVAELSGRLMAVEELARERDVQIREMQKRITELEDAVEARDGRITELEAENDTMRRTLSYYQNANTPPPSASLEHKKRKR